MRSARVLVCIRAAVLVLPMAVACSSSPPANSNGGGDNSGSGGSGNGGNSGNGSGNGGNSGNGSGNGGNSGNGSGNGGNGSGNGGNSGNGSGNGGNSSGNGGNSGNGSGGNGGNGGSTGSSGGNGSGGNGGSTGSSGGNGGNGGSSGSASSSGSSGSSGSGSGAASACGTPGANVLSDFEQDTGTMITQGGRTGYWYVFADTVAGTQTPTAVANGPIAVSAAPTGDPTPMGETCNKYALNSTSTGHTAYSGVGAAFSPSAGMMRAAYDLTKYDGIQFDVETTSGSEGAVYFEMLTKESQPGPAYAAANPGTVATGTATNGSVDAYNNRGYLLAGVGQTPTGVGTALTSSFQTVYVPFSLLVPFYFPDLTACGTTKPCQAPNFVPTNALAFQFNATADFSTTGGYNLWIDNVSLYTGENGLTPPGMTMPTFNDGAKGFASCKGAIPTFAGGRTASGKYLLWAYRNWKQHFVVASGGGFKVVRPDTGDNNDTVSEGIGYGMLLAVYFNDKTLFDGLWAYAQQNAASGLLMTWHIPGGSGSATDADEDMAFALVEAGKLWGGTYAGTASTMISQIATSDIDWADNLPTGGSNYGNSTTAKPTNPSYFAPAYYRVFAGIDTGHAWSALADNTIKVISSLSGSNGLVPAWCGNNCAAAAMNSGSLNPATDEIYQYDAQRVPWRVGVDYCWNGTSSAASYLSKISAFFAGQAAGGIGALYDEYSLSGAPYTGAVANSMSLIGSSAVGAMSGSNGTYVAEAWQMVLDGINRGEPNLVATKNTYYTYYNATVGLLTALTMSGNFYSM